MLIIPINPPLSPPLDYLDELQSLVETKKLEPPIENAVPLLIHCSAGVGRSGVLLLMDLLTNAFRKNEVHQGHNDWSLPLTDRDD